MTNSRFTTTIIPLINNQDPLALINYFRQRNVLKYEICCTFCSKKMRQVKKSSATDGYSFRCFKKTCTKYRTFRSIRSESILDEFSIPLKKLLHFFYLFSLETSQETIMELVGISESLVYKLVSFLRDRIKSYFLSNPILLGGPHVVVQIDESKFNFNVKSHRGHAPVDATWVFGIVDTSYVPARGYMEIVERRDKRTLFSIIERHVRSNSIIHSDEWAAYNDLNELGYEHETVCHKYNFVNPANGVHTQKVESYWNRQKFRIKKSKGLKKSAVRAVLKEYMFRDLFAEDVYESVLCKLLNY